jgi:hypothetical protein
LPVAEQVTLKSGAVAAIQLTRMSCGSSELSLNGSRPASTDAGRFVRNCTTCPAACTPASVRPAALTPSVSRASRSTVVSARSTCSCTVGARGCSCQPL